MILLPPSPFLPKEPPPLPTHNLIHCIHLNLLSIYMQILSYWYFNSEYWTGFN